MQTGPLLALALAGGFAAGAMGGLLFAPGTPAEEGGPLTSAPLSASAGDDVALEQRFLSLQAEYATVETQLARMQSKLDALANRREAVSMPEADEADEESTSDRQYAELEAVPYTLEEEQRFAAYLDARERQEEAEREAERERRREEARQRQIDRLAEQLGLNEYQKSEMNRVLGEADAARRKAFEEMRAAGDFDRDEMRAKMEELNEQQNQQLGSFLTPQQLEQYQDSRGGWFDRARGGDRRGGGGDRDGGGGGRGGF